MVIPKSQIEITAIYNPRTLVAEHLVSRRGNVLTFRHAWPPEKTDGRTWGAITNTVSSYAQKIANETDRDVKVYAKQGWKLMEFNPK